MKKYFKVGLLMIFVLVMCTGCNGNVTRDIRHAGFAIGQTIKCDAFFPENKDDVYYEKMRYFTGNHIINTDGKIYEVSLSQTFTNGQHCKEADTYIRVNAIMDNQIVKTVDGRYYYLFSQNNVPSYTEVPPTDNSYAIYDILLKDSDVVKVVTADSSTGLYYTLKEDGNVYGSIISSTDRNSPPKLLSTQIVYSQVDYEGPIVDFNYAGNSLNTFVLTSDKLYRMKITNGLDCTKYADLNCEFKMTEDPIYEQYKDRIIAYNGAVLITDYKQMFTVAS